MQNASEEEKKNISCALLINAKLEQIMIALQFCLTNNGKLPHNVTRDFPSAISDYNCDDATYEDVIRLISCLK